MRPFVRSYGVICTRTLSPRSKRILFIRILPAKWQRIMCPFVNRTRNIVAGNSSVTSPSISRKSFPPVDCFCSTTFRPCC